MVEYKLEVTTGEKFSAGTWDRIYVTITGTAGEIKYAKLDNSGFEYATGKTRTYILKNESSLGKLLLIKVEKKRFLLNPEDYWYLSNIVVTPPEEEEEAVLFPYYRWIYRGQLVELRGGKALKAFEEDNQKMIDHRKKELTLKKNRYQWRTLEEGIPSISHFNETSELPAEMQFSVSRMKEIKMMTIQNDTNLNSHHTLGSTTKWESIEDMKNIFWWKKTIESEYVKEHWKEDDFYGFQFLNGVNPNVIKLCSELPPNFPVTEEMVKPFLKGGTSLQEEMKKGNMFLYDQKKMDGIPTRPDASGLLHVTAGLCLLYLNPKKQLMPIAIQLHQQPSEQNPIFLPSDSETDWLLAKMFIKNADAMDHEAVQHLMKTHFLAEVYNVAFLRSFSVIHPLYKLLAPHFESTLHINTEGRHNLFGPKGALSISSLGYDGLTELMRRALSEMTYSSLCLPEDITARGLDSIPNFYYRDDGLKLWSVINSFVKAVVEYYYPSDSEVLKDTELQDWISEIFTHGFLGKKASGFPASFHTVEEVIKFIAMVIFTVTVQHAAVNNGQFDYYSWAPNNSLLLHNPPPTTKGQSSMETILETLPNVGDTLKIATLVCILSGTYSDMVPIGTYPDERFHEPAPKQMIQKFQAELSDLSEEISERNESLQKRLELPYRYLHPAQIENSISI